MPQSNKQPHTTLRRSPRPSLDCSALLSLRVPNLHRVPSLLNYDLRTIQTSSQSPVTLSLGLPPLITSFQTSSQNPITALLGAA